MIAFLGILFLSFLLQSTSGQIEEKDISFSIQETAVKNDASLELYSDLWESAWVWADAAGWINGRAEFHSKDLGFGEQNLNLFILSYPNSYELFDHADWWFAKTNDPRDLNTEVVIHFKTNNALIAKDYADLMVEYMSRSLSISYNYEGTWAWEDWRDDKWIDLTGVRYRSHIDWPWFTEYINNNIIPRSVGGLAETIDVTGAGNINAWAWPSGDTSNPEIRFAFGFDFYHNIFDLTGSYSGNHILCFNELIHTEKIQKNAYQDQLWLTYELPDVAAITHIPSTNTSACNIYQIFHPPPEPWVANHYWDVNFEIQTGVYTSLSVSFVYDFIPGFLQTGMGATLIINHYGYLYKDIRLRGDYSRFIDFESLTNWDSNILIVELAFRPTRESLWNSFEFSVFYNDSNDHYIAANALAIELGNILGISFSSNHTEENRWNWNRFSYEGIGYRFHSDDFTLVMSQNLLSNSDVVQSTPAFDNQDLLTTTEYRQWSYYHPEVNQWIDEAVFQWNPLGEEFINPIKSYPGLQNDLSIEILTEWDWAAFPHCSNYSISRFEIMVPYDDYKFYPEENNGWGWHVETSEENWWNLDYVRHNLEVYTDATSLEYVDDYGVPNGTLFNQFGITIDYNFLENSVDTSPPGGNFYYRNTTSGEEYWGDWNIQQHKIAFTGLDDHLHIHVWDDCTYGIQSFGYPFYYWDGSDWQPRFGSSGINNTILKAYFADLPVQMAQFERDIPIVVYWQDGLIIDYNVSWDTTDGFADGEWTLIAYSEDNNGNAIDFAIHNVLVDNYNEELTDSPIITLLTAENTSVYGTHKIQVEVTDDVEIFAVALTRDATAFLLSDPDVDGIYEFEWNTLGEVENSIHFFTITVWDMDGHKAIYGFWLQADNIRPGDPPLINIISPGIENETLTGFYTFQVQVTDDLGLESVKMQIDRGTMRAMDLNPITGYYESTHDLTTEINGYRILNITVIDVDENQHTEHAKMGFTVIGGQEGPTVSDPPEWNPSLSELPENLTDYVNTGNLIDYEPVSGNIYFKIATKDDREITTVNFKVYVIDDFNPSTGDLDLGRVVLDRIMNHIGSEDEWIIYEYLWDSTEDSDNYYLCQIDVQDDDTVANHLYVGIVLQTDNVIDEGPTLAGIPGFDFEFVLIGLISCHIGAFFLKRKKDS